MYYRSGSKLGDGDIKVNETWTLALNIFKSGKRDRQIGKHSTTVTI